MKIQGEYRLVEISALDTSPPKIRVKGTVRFGEGPPVKLEEELVPSSDLILHFNLFRDRVLNELRPN